jgi:serine/threonine-protein kinase
MAQSATFGKPVAIQRARTGSQQAANATASKSDDTTSAMRRSAGELQRIAHEEHVENLARSRLVWTIGVAGAVGLMAIEIGYHGLQGPAPRYFAPRLLLIAAPALAVLRCHKISAAELRTVDATVYATAAAAIALIAAQTGGFESPAVDGVSCIIIAQSLTLLDRPLQTAFRLAVTLAVFAAVVTAICALGSSDLSGTLRGAHGYAALGQHLFVQALVAAMAIAAGHTHWSARRTIHASRTAGKYVLKKCIGKGGMGEVWLGHLPDFQRDVAVKLMRCDDADPQAIARFGREVAALAELRHPNTVQILDWGVAENSLYYAMELLSGETLKALVLREGPLPPERAVAMARQVARALAEAHERGIIHRDVKPDNLFVTGEKRDFVKVLDFGVAKITSDATGLSQSSITRVGMVVGTAGYMAPEQVLSGPIDPATDVYALGAVLFFMLTGRAPFMGSNVVVMRAQLQSLPPPIAELCPGALPPALAAVVRKCLEKASRNRFHSMLDLDAALRSALLPPDEQPAVGPDGEPPTTRRNGRKRPTSVRPSATHRLAATHSASLTPPTVRYPKDAERRPSVRPRPTPSIPPS